MKISMNEMSADWARTRGLGEAELSRPSDGGARLMLAAILVLFLVSAITSALRKDVAQGFDELAHISYVAELQSEGDLVPLTQVRMLDPASFQFRPVANYLNHPPLYYTFHALAGPSLEGHPGALVWHRLIDIAIAALALGLLLAAGLAWCRDRTELFVYAVALGCIPVLAPLAGAVNNDNLAFLGGALTLFGAQRYTRRQGTADLAIVLLGLIVAGAAKLTALMLCGGFLVALFGFLWWRDRPHKAHVVLLLAGFAIAAAPVFALWFSYGSPAPDTPAQHALLVEGARAAGWADHERLGPLAYLGRFMLSFVDGWMPTLAEKPPLRAAMAILPVACLLLSAIGTAIALKRIATRSPAAGPLEMIVGAGAVALAATFVVHTVFSYQRHLDTGWMMDAYPRYYLPLIPILPLAALVLLRRVGQGAWHRTLAGFFIAAPIAFRLLG